MGRVGVSQDPCDLSQGEAIILNELQGGGHTDVINHPAVRRPALSKTALQCAGTHAQEARHVLDGRVPIRQKRRNGQTNPTGHILGFCASVHRQIPLVSLPQREIGVYK
jgi:hypothetical protein